MDMLQPSCVVFLIILWISLELPCKASITTPDFFPMLTNVKMSLKPGIINVTWDCNITKSIEEHTYHIEFSHGTKEHINISRCFHELFISDHLEFVIHNGLDATISSGSRLNSKLEVNALPEGKINTAAENLHCYVSNISIINCSWTVGSEAPKDTQYTLAFRQTPHESQIANPKQNRIYLPCKDYRMDSFGRQVGCVLKSQKIRFNVSIYVELVGSSSETSIQFFDRILKLDDFVILDPPRNIHVNYNGTVLDITWDPPETYSDSGSHCFMYSVIINGDIKDDVTEQFYKTSNLHMNEKVNVSLKAKWESCSNNGKWSRWSDPIIKEPHSSLFSPTHFLIALGVITFAVLLVLLVLCHRFQVWKRLFPQIPEPAKNLLETIEQKEFLFQEQNITRKSQTEEDEECICLQITEIPEKEQPQHHYMNIPIQTPAWKQ